MKRALALAVLLAACNEIDKRDAEEKVKEIAETSVGPVKSVSCPTAKRTKGVKFTCRVAFQSGGTGNLEIELVDGDGNFTPRWVPWIVDGDRLATTLADAVRDQQPELGDLAVECGTGVIEVPTEGVPCHVKGAKIETDLIVKAGPDGIAWEIKK